MEDPDESWETATNYKKVVKKALENPSSHINHTNPPPLAKQQPLQVLYNPDGTQVIRIPISEFDNARYTYTFVSFDLSKILDDINQLFKSSSNYMELKTKPNFNRHNQMKWNTKPVELSDTDKIIGNINKITSTNYLTIKDEISKLHVITYDELKTIVNALFISCTVNSLNTKNYVMLIKSILLEFAWVVYDNSNKPITFRKLFVDTLETYFNNMISTVKSKKNDSEKNKRKIFMVLICELFDAEIFGNQLFRYIFNNLETAFKETNNEEFVEYWIIMFPYSQQNWTSSNKVYLNDKIKFFKDIYDLLSNRLQVLNKDLMEKIDL